MSAASVVALVGTEGYLRLNHPAIPYWPEPLGLVTREAGYALWRVGLGSAVFREVDVLADYQSAMASFAEKPELTYLAGVLLRAGVPYTVDPRPYFSRWIWGGQLSGFSDMASDPSLLVPDEPLDNLIRRMPVTNLAFRFATTITEENGEDDKSAVAPTRDVLRHYIQTELEWTEFWIRKSHQYGPYQTATLSPSDRSMWIFLLIEQTLDLFENNTVSDLACLETALALAVSQRTSPVILFTRGRVQAIENFDDWTAKLEYRIAPQPLQRTSLNILGESVAFPVLRPT